MGVGVGVNSNLQRFFTRDLQLKNELVGGKMAFYEIE